MKTNLILLIVLSFSFSAMGQSASSRKMHRIRDTTKNELGQYYGKSTEGNFSVLMPIPFNDFTVTMDSVSVFGIGSKSQEGIKFSVMENIKEKTATINLDALVEEFNNSGNTIENIKKEKNNNIESISFSVADKSNGAIVKYVNTKISLFTMIIEFPIEYKKLVEENFIYFFSSLNISNY